MPPARTSGSRGGDLGAGEPVVAAGVRLGAAHLGALAAAGVTAVQCHRRPAVVVAVTGTELRRPGEPLARGEIYDANGLILATQIASTGAGVERLGARRRRRRRRRGPRSSAGSRPTCSSRAAGSRSGVYDLVRASEAELGVEEVFWRVAVRPGKPVAFGVRGRTLVFGLPGNPVSSLVGFELFVRPALLALQGLADPSRRSARVGSGCRVTLLATRVAPARPDRGSRTVHVVSTRSSDRSRT